MSRLRPECGTSNRPALPYETALFLVRDALKRRRQLGYGRLHDPVSGLPCAMGAAWDDNPRMVVNASLVDEVAAVNDSDPHATPYERWRKVNGWLKLKLRLLAGGKPM